MEQKNYFDSLTGFRALAAGMVLIGHLAIKMNLGDFWYIKYGWTGVNLFFTLSGFLFTYLYFDKFASHTQSIKEYILKRVIRIYPLVAFLVLLTVITRPNYSLADIFSHLTLLHSYIRDFRYTINPPMWTLTVEESFYFLVPILMVFLYALWNIHWFKTVKSKIFFIGFILLFISFGLSNIGTQITNLQYYFFGIWDKGLLSSTIFGRFFDFGIGITAGLIFLKMPESKIFNNKLISNLLFVVGALVWLGGAYWIETHHGEEFVMEEKLYQYFFYLYSTGAAIMLLSLVGNSFFNRIFSWGPVVYLGKVSFALYLVQFMSLGPWKNISMSIKAYFLQTTGNNWLSVFATFFVIFIFSSIVYHLIEMPSQKYLKKWFLKSK
jgi:peptidoglycan/LPS O-acetylase OafA/YrhL